LTGDLERIMMKKTQHLIMVCGIKMKKLELDLQAPAPPPSQINAEYIQEYQNKFKQYQ
jgi:hypothetical protein